MAFAAREGHQRWGPDAMKTEATIIRGARPDDLETLGTFLEKLGLPTAGVRDHLGQFLVLEQQGDIVGTVGLEMYGDRALLRSLGVARSQQGCGLGRTLCEAILARARSCGIREIVLLTETAARFFTRWGFEVVSRDEVDAAVRQSAEFGSACPASATCMRLRLR